jgi:hypothetical protein
VKIFVYCCGASEIFLSTTQNYLLVLRDQSDLKKKIGMLRKVLAVPVQRCLNQVRRNMAVCVVAQHDNKTLDFSVANAVKAASSLDKDLTVLVAGKGCQEVAKQVSKSYNSIITFFSKM